jgi:hypothetical protein
MLQERRIIMAKLTGNGLAAFAVSKLGVPYVYGAKGADGKFTQAKFDFLARNYPKVFTFSYKIKAKKLIGKVCCDCSGLISWYTKKVLGSAQLYSTASKRGLIKDVHNAPIGAVLWKEGHVGVYIGDGYCIEEKGIDFGCVKSKISNTKFTHWLTFNYMEYDEPKEPVVISKKKNNPYDKPTTLLIKGSKGEGVKWLQFELCEAGYSCSIDGDFGKNTLAYVKKFQQSCKLTVDGEVGSKTVAALVANK